MRVGTKSAFLTPVPLEKINGAAHVLLTQSPSVHSHLLVPTDCHWADPLGLTCLMAAREFFGGDFNFATFAEERVPLTMC